MMEPPHDQPPPLPPHPPALPPQHAPTLLYHQPESMQPTTGSGGLRFLWLFLIGAIGGAAVSAVAWIGGWDAIDKNAYLIFVVPGVKLVAAIPLLCFGKWRGLGAGLMVSIALGFLIFFGSCMTHIKM